ncbi:MAG: histidine phosphatase family protein [Candidatus Thioglobus sp.]|nr:MAG: histidine phosphatase family protein [Candidatus Thioglobus sp.]KAA0455928.1 MAG: histidine phosphatase family protein [Candidatus Thioglobus sp.]
MLDLLRHGEVCGGRLYRGNLLDDALSAKGFGQMQASTKGKHWDFIATSPMLRCLAFAKYLSQTQKIEMQVFEPLKEIGFGDWQGKSVEEIGYETVDKFKQNPLENRPKNAEKLSSFQSRVLSALAQITDANPNKSILIISHAGVIRVIKSHLLKLPIEKMFTIQVVQAACERFEL